MKPVDLRNANFRELQRNLSAIRSAVLNAWMQYGPETTRVVSERAAMDILTFRPRTTELFQMGLLRMVETLDHEGIYQVRSIPEWEAWRREQLAIADSGQLQLV